jgi:hypothetical protein
MDPLIVLQYQTVTDFVNQLINGNIISSVGDKNMDDLDKKILKWLERNYEKNFSIREDDELQKLTKEIFDRIVYLRLAGFLSGVLSIPKF